MGTTAAGAGNDEYVINGSETLVEQADEGLDTVTSYGDYLLPAVFENLTLAGTARFAATDLDASDVIFG